MIDLMRYFAGEFTSVKSFVSNNFWNFDVEDNAYALMKSERDVIAFIHSTATQWRHKFQLEINFTRGALILAGILSGTKSYGQETLTVIRKEDDDNGNPKEQRTSYIKDNSWRDEIYEFADCVLNDKKVETGSSLDALNSMSLVYQIYTADSDWAQKFDIVLPNTENN